MRRTVIGVMGPGSADDAALEEAFALGELVARAGWILLTGGRRAGVMDAASRGAKRVAGSITVGILPGTRDESDVSDHVDIAIFSNMGDARNAINVSSSDVVVAFGAATPGTLSEAALALKAGRHVVLLRAPVATRDALAAMGGRFVHVATDPRHVMGIIGSLGIQPGAPWLSA